MARTSNITFGQVAAIADAMQAAGNRPTARAVRERIGSGSMGTIHKLLQQWQGKGIADEETEAAELPTHIQNALMDFIGTEIATACEPINEDLQNAKEAADALATENERLEAIIDRLQIERDEAQRSRAEAVGKSAELGRELSELKAHLAEANTRNTEYLRDIDRAMRQVEMLTSFQTELTATKAALEKSETNRFESEKEAAVLAAQLDATKRQAADLGDRLKATECQSRTKDEALKQANNHYQACAARLEAAAREIESLKKPKPVAKATATKKPEAKKATDGNT